MKSVPFTAYPRTATRHNQVKRLRSTGRVPAVIYGAKVTPQNLELPAKELEKLIHQSVSENILVNLSITNDARPSRLALVQQVQHHPLSGLALHVDFHEVAEDETVIITVPVESVGEAAGVKTGGGTLEHVLFRLKVRALPKDLPEVITVDVSHLEIGTSIHLGDIKAPVGVTILGDPHLSVFAVAAPITEAQEAEAAAAAGTAAPPEMIKEKKEDGAPDAAAKPDAKGGAKPEAKADAKGAEKAGEKKAEKKK